MGPDAVTVCRRWLGILVLVAALGMLIAGETVLDNRLKGLGFLGYWFGCFILTALAIVIAFVDARAVRRQSRRQEKELLENALKEIEVDARLKEPQANKNAES
jgi:hypothetical protein